ncbi:hypothetical protein P5673_018424 [Acropora cervicornis]|uniref:Uncharacterized protein n=1 Tax=Acropora cervicornis TaxID=6130 RepID=A0AAD9QDM5_ACRCE|nr:hypothetical protein P5673_018424 [Acropora cervicornis]
MILLDVLNFHVMGMVVSLKLKHLPFCMAILFAEDCDLYRRTGALILEPSSLLRRREVQCNVCFAFGYSSHSGNSTLTSLSEIIQNLELTLPMQIKFTNLQYSAIKFYLIGPKNTSHEVVAIAVCFVSFTITCQNSCSCLVMCRMKLTCQVIRSHEHSGLKTLIQEPTHVPI